MGDSQSQRGVALHTALVQPKPELPRVIQILSVVPEFQLKIWLLEASVQLMLAQCLGQPCELNLPT